MIIGSKLSFYKELTSTNETARLQLRKSDLPEGYTIHTDFQIAGKGQSGNRWESQDGKNLLFSIILYPKSVDPQDQFYISMMISLGIHDFISSHLEGCKIKWPNDIYINDDKIAGILVENTLLGDLIESTIAGIGLNVNQQEFPGYISNPVSMRLAAGKEFDRQLCLIKLLSDLDSRYRQLIYGDRESLKGEYVSHLYRLKEWNRYRCAEKDFEGRLTGISDSGMLRIEDRNGSLMEYRFKEIDYVP